MSEFRSVFREQLYAYCNFREQLGFTDNHRKMLDKFDKYCLLFHPTVSQLTQTLVCGWIKYEIKSEHGSIDHKCTAIRGFAKFLGEDAYVLTEKYSIKKRNFIPYILSDEELSNLFKAADKVKKRGDPFFAETAGVIFRLQYACGLRPTEVRTIREKDINFSTGEILIRKNKVSKERIVVASFDVVELLKQYRNRRRLFSRLDNDTFFIHTNGNSISSEQLTDLLQKCWREANPKIDAKLLPRLRPYDLRHRFASAVLQRWVDEGKDLYVMRPYLRAYMGHEEFRDTLYYIHIMPERILQSKAIDWDHLEEVNLEEQIWKA